MKRLRLQAILEDNNGFAPLVVTIIIVIILSLLTVGFVSLMRNNQKNTLNRQLNNDAYYAAETGVNDAIQAIGHGFNSSKTSCQPIQSNTYLKNQYINGSNNDYYSCLLINPTPASLQYSSIGLNQPTVAVLSAVNGSNQPTNIAYIKISWQPSSQVASGSYQFAPAGWLSTCSSASGPCLPAQTSWVVGSQPITGILRTALTPLYTGSLPTDTSTTYTTFLYPAQGNGVTSIAPDYSPSTTGANAGVVVGGQCLVSTSNTTQPDACNVEINVSSAATSAFLISLRSIYNRTQATIQIFDSSNNPLSIRGAQTLIDSTGYSHGVLRRIQVRVPGLNDTGFPAFDLEATNKLCKDIQTYPQNQSTGNAGQTIAIDPSCSL